MTARTHPVSVPIVYTWKFRRRGTTMVYEPSMKKMVLDLLVEEECYVTVFTGECQVHGLLTENTAEGGYRVTDGESYFMLYDTPDVNPNFYDELEIRFEKDGSIMIYPEQVL